MADSQYQKILFNIHILKASSPRKRGPPNEQNGSATAHGTRAQNKNPTYSIPSIQKLSTKRPNSQHLMHSSQ